MRALDGLLRHRVSIALASCWTLSAAVLAVLPDRSVEGLLERASTTLPRLAAWPLTLPVSGLLVHQDLAVWLLALLLGVDQLERALGWRRTVTLLAGVHAGATVLSQALLGTRVAVGHAPYALLGQVDVGPSYLSVGGLAAAAVLAPTRGRAALAAGALAVSTPELLEGLRHLDLAATGHLAAALLGAGGGWWSRPASVPAGRRRDVNSRSGPDDPA